MPDLGCNKVWRLNFKSTGDGSGWEILGEIGGFKLGDGPRHIAIHPDGGFASRGSGHSPAPR